MSDLDEIQARADAATEGPWRALTTGRTGGDHWYICDEGEAIASVASQDGFNEDQREPDAEFIAHAREDVPKLVAALRHVEVICASWNADGEVDMAIAKTIPHGNAGAVLLMNGADKIENARIIRQAIQDALA